jgi:hypothetical protein
MKWNRLFRCGSEVKIEAWILRDRVKGKLNCFSGINFEVTSEPEQVKTCEIELSKWNWLVWVKSNCPSEKLALSEVELSQGKWLSWVKSNYDRETAVIAGVVAVAGCAVVIVLTVTGTAGGERWSLESKFSEQLTSSPLKEMSATWRLSFVRDNASKRLLRKLVVCTAKLRGGEVWSVIF